MRGRSRSRSDSGGGSGIRDHIIGRNHLKRSSTDANSDSDEVYSPPPNPMRNYDHSPSWSPDTRDAYREFGIFGLVQRRAMKVNGNIFPHAKY